MTTSEGSRATSYSIEYHEKTKYTPEGLARSARQLDWSAQPRPYKEYRTGVVLDLRPYLPGQPEAEQNASSAQPDAGVAERCHISYLLYLTYGITAMVPHPAQPFYLRAAPSAGGLYPAEVYLISRGSAGFPPGLYNYQVQSHSLVRFWSGDAWSDLEQACFNHAAFTDNSLAIAVSVVFLRSAWRYEDRAYRRVFLDSGHLLGNLELASANGYHVHLVTGFLDDLVNDRLFLPKEEEAVIALAVLGPEGTTANTCCALPSDVVTDYRPVPEGQRLNFLHEISKLNQWRPLPAVAESREDKYNFPFCLKVPMQTEPLDWQGTLEQTIIRRRSTRRYTGEDLTLAELKHLLDFTYQPGHYRDQGFDCAPEYAHLQLLETFVVVLGVEGLEAGCYYYAPRSNELRQVRFKNFRSEVHRLCLGQDLGRDSGAVVFHTADLPVAVRLYGERAYRTLHLDSGHLGQRLNLAAIRLGLGVSGIAGFFDDQVNEVLGIPEQEAVLYITTLGRPASEL